MNSNDEITVVFALGAQKSLLKSTQSRNLNDKFTGYSFQTESGEQISLNPFEYEKDTNIRIRNMNNKFLLDSINMNRFTNGLKPVVDSGFKLNQLSQNETNRMVSANKIIKPEFKIIDQRSILVAINLQGTTQMKEFFFGFKNNNNGTIACFDNFSSETAQIYSIYELKENICSKEAVDELSKFNSFGSGITYNTNGDLFTTLALSAL